ncbi:rhodanese-like domain-containing protein [Actinacidiphila alni]|uniref:rhodanese-like domain-containing protein n=1 Tax=Actinacidiphila alni TaxID=380248 RepID=UPI003455C9FA
MALEEHLAAARARLQRLDAKAAARAAEEDGALLVDIRYGALRDRDGTIPGAVIVERNELEWRLDPAGTHRLARVTSYDLPVVVICNEGWASSLAAATLQDLGLRAATDLDGGFQAWRAAGLPVTAPTGEPTAPTPHIAEAEEFGPPAT